jgi:hypothetical protein
MLKKLIIFIAVGVFLCGLTACGSAGSQKSAGSGASQAAASSRADNAAQSEASAADEKGKSETAAADDKAKTGSSAEQKSKKDAVTGSGKETLVVYFSATGTTKKVAQKIAAIEDADLYEIEAADPYSDEDLDWNDTDSRSTKEQNDSSARPKIASKPVDLSGYSRIYVGYPIWWGEEPRIMDTFVESYDFGDAEVIPFCTSSSSGIGRSGKNLADLAKGGNWRDGSRFSGSVSEGDLKSWIKDLH